MSTITREPVTHNLKIWPEYYAAVCKGEKRAELRWNDRDYHAGDTLDLCEWDPNEEAFTGEFISVNVTHVAELGQWMPGYVLLSIALPSSNAEPVAWLWSHRKHPREVTLVRPEDDEKAEAAHWSGWSCQALCLVPPELVSQETADREMLKRLAVILSGSDAPGEIRSLTVTARSFVERCKILAKERDECRISMLQGTDGNSPVIPDGWVACSERMPEVGSTIMVFMDKPQHSATDYAITTFDKYGFSRAKVTHWQPLPAAPKQEV